MHNTMDNAWSHERSEWPPFKGVCERLASQIEALNCASGSAHSVTLDQTTQLMSGSL
jgi:hypothetical protein